MGGLSPGRVRVSHLAGLVAICLLRTSLLARPLVSSSSGCLNLPSVCHTERPVLPGARPRARVPGQTRRLVRRGGCCSMELWLLVAAARCCCLYFIPPPAVLRVLGCCLRCCLPSTPLRLRLLVLECTMLASRGTTRAPEHPRGVELCTSPLRSMAVACVRARITIWSATTTRRASSLGEWGCCRSCFSSVFCGKCAGAFLRALAARCCDRDTVSCSLLIPDSLPARTVMPNPFAARRRRWTSTLRPRGSASATRTPPWWVSYHFPVFPHCHVAALC